MSNVCSEEFEAFIGPMAREMLVVMDISQPSPTAEI
jgi:hypothetical protein